MKQLILAIAILFSKVANAQTAWENIVIDDNATISFPTMPTKNETNKGQLSYILKQADSTANFIVPATNIGEMMGIDAETLKAEMEKEESWEQAKTAFVGSLGSTAVLVKDEMTTLKDTKALKLIVDRKNSIGVVNTFTVLIFVKGTVSYNIIFNNRGGKADEKMKEQFFNSILLK